MERKYGMALLTACFIMLFSACNANKAKQAAEQGVAKFHEQLDGEAYHEIFSESDPEFQKAASESDTTEFLKAVHRKLGNVKSAREQAFFVNFNTSGTRVTLTYQTDFVDGPATEQFIWFIGDRAKLVSYRIDSRTLITK